MKRPGRASKRDLGVSYFLGLGLGLIVSLVGYFILVSPTAPGASVGTLTAIGFASTLPYVGYWLRRSSLSDTEVWNVARWCAIGITIPTVFVGGLSLVGIHPRLVIQFPHLLVNLITFGAVGGTVLGLVRELRRQYRRVDELNQRNTILNQLMRHDIKNDVTVIDGYVERIAAETEDVDDDLLTPIQQKSKEIMETSEVAQHVQTLDDDTHIHPIDVTEVVSESLDGIQTTYPEVTITTDLPAEAEAQAGELLQTVIDNLVENAIEHNDTTPHITITVSSIDGKDVGIRVSDNGPGMPPADQQVLTADSVPSAEDSSGLGLWLVRWIIDRYNGTITVDANQPRGTIIELILPAASPR